MATSSALSNWSFKLPTKELAPGLGSGSDTRMSRDQPYHRLEFWDSSTVSVICNFLTSAQSSKCLKATNALTTRSIHTCT